MLSDMFTDMSFTELYAVTENVHHVSTTENRSIHVSLIWPDTPISSRLFPKRYRSHMTAYKVIATDAIKFVL